MLLTPIIFLTTCWQKLVYRVFRPSKDRGITEEELITIVEEAENEGEIDEHESELIRSAIEFNDMTAEDILTPRVDIVSAELHSTPDEIARIFEKSGRSRIPVYEDSIDNIVGILHEKDFYRLRGKAPLREMMSKPLCVVPSTQLAVLLKLLQRTKNHMAVVVDEYGGVVGIVTMEDILEELVGEIWDEHDEVVEDIVPLSEDEWRVSGSASLDDLRQRLPIGDDYESVTVNGWVLEVLGHLPQPGDAFDYENLHVTVQRVARRRVEQIRIDRKQPRSKGVNAMKAQLYAQIEASRVPLTARQLSEENQCPLEAVQAALDALAGEGRIASTRKGGWAVPETIGLTAARVPSSATARRWPKP